MKNVHKFNYWVFAEQEHKKPVKSTSSKLISLYYILCPVSLGIHVLYNVHVYNNNGLVIFIHETILRKQTTAL